MSHPPAALDPVAHGLPRDPSDWTDEEEARFTAAVAALKLDAEPHPSTLGLPRDLRSWTDAQRAINRAAKAAWFATWAPGKDVIVSCNLKETDDGELVPAENWGEVTPMDYRDYPLAAYSRRPTCNKRIRARARSGLRGGRPSSRRGAAASSRSSSNGSDSEGESEPPEYRRRTFLRRTSRLHVVASSAPIGAGFARLHAETPMLSGSERLRAFGALPQARQDNAWADLRQAVEAEREAVAR